MRKLIVMHRDPHGRRRRAFFGIAVLLVLGGIAGCSEILGIESNRYLDAGVAEASAQDVVAEDVATEAIEAGFDGGAWGCLGQAPQLFPPNAMTTVTFLAVDALQPITQAQKVDGGSGLDLISYTPLPGVPVRACPTVLDPDCAQGTPTMTTDDGGTATFTLPQNWNGFYRVTDTSIFTTTLYPGAMIAGQTSTTVPAPLLTIMGEAELEPFLPVNVSHDLDGGVGHVLISVYDCQDHFAPGVQFRPGATSDGGNPTLIFYLEGSSGQELPTTSADSTDQGGAGGILNLPIGIQPITAVVLATDAGPEQTIGTVSVLVNPGVGVQLFVRARTE